MEKFFSQFGPHGEVEMFLRRHGLWLLLAFALIYYGQYYRAGLYPAAEGGVEGMVALRLLAGQRPIVDTFLGYNLLWFYPVVLLFKLVGPNYTALRLFFLTLCTLTGLMSFRLVLKSTGRAWPAFLAGVLVLLVPGQMFRNYMSFLAVLNMMVFLSAYVLASPGIGRRLLWMVSCGFTLGLAFLIRVDVGFLLSFVLLGLIVTFPIGCRKGCSPRKRVVLAVIGLVLAATGLFLTHLPVYMDAERRGFAPQFVGQYKGWPEMIQAGGGRLIDAASAVFSKMFDSGHNHQLAPSLAPGAVKSPVPSASGVASTLASPQKISKPAVSNEARSTLGRRSLTGSSNARDLMLALNLYLPIPIAIMIGLWAVAAWIRAIFLKNEEERQGALVLLTCLGCSLVLFSQYFFWRPDMVHLSEFMVPMTLTIIISCVKGFSFMRRAGVFSRVALCFYLVFAILTLVLYEINACQSQSSGGIAASLNKRLDFRAANGVNVKLTPSEYRDAYAVYRIVSAVSGPEDYLICYPYNPEVNFMTGRPSYEYNLYVDNATSPETFQRETLAKIAKYRPVAFYIVNWQVNNTEYSEFKNWAAGTYDYIAANYRLAYRRGNVELFVRPDRAALIPPGLY